MTDGIMHLDDIVQLAVRAGNAHAVGFEENDDELNYERFGICTADLLHVAQVYGRKTVRQTLDGGGGFGATLTLQFLAGFDLGYQARLELETRELTNDDS